MIQVTITNVLSFPDWKADRIGAITEHILATMANSARAYEIGIIGGTMEQHSPQDREHLGHLFHEATLAGQRAAIDAHLRGWSWDEENDRAPDYAEADRVAAEVFLRRVMEDREDGASLRPDSVDGETRDGDQD